MYCIEQKYTGNESKYFKSGIWYMATYLKSTLSGQNIMVFGSKMFEIGRTTCVFLRAIVRSSKIYFIATKNISLASWESFC